MLRFCALALAVALSAAASAGDLAGTWSGTWTKNGDALPVTVTFASGAAGMSGSFSSDALQVSDVPFQTVTFADPSVHFVLAGDTATDTFDGTLNGDALDGSFSEGNVTGSFHLTRMAAPPAALATRDVTYPSGTVTLAGTLILPQGAGRHPAILFLHGSGPEGRWASRYLAERFARAGFVALITDKRGVGASTGDWRTADFSTLANDALAGIAFLRAQPDVDARKTGLYGHSQGGTIAPMIAARAGNLAFVIAAAAGGTDMADMEDYSIGNAIGIAALPADQQAAAKAYVKALVDTAYRGAPMANFLALAAADKAQSWYFDPPPPTSYYWWFSRHAENFTPSFWWRQVKAPVLLLYGSADQRVPPEASSKAILAALAAGHNTKVALKMFADADHSFALPSGGWPKHAPGVIATMTDWANAAVK